MKNKTFQYRNIAISGLPATGTSTLAKNLSEKLGWKKINVGDIQREFDRKRGMDERYVGSDTRDDEWEKGIENMTKEILSTRDHLIYEAWLAGFIARNMNDVLKVLLVCRDDLRIDRLVNRDKISVKDAKRQITEREKGNIKKWKALYGDYNFWDPKYFDIVIDTYSSGPYETLGKVLDKLGVDPNARNGIKK